MRKKNKSHFLTQNNGQTLIEAVVALGIILITLSAIAVAVIVSVNNSTFISNENKAAKLSQDGIEFIKNSHTNNSNVRVYNAGTGTYENIVFEDVVAGNYCYPGEGSTNLNSIQNITANPECETTVNLDNQYIRTFHLENDVTCNGKKVTVKTRWNSTKCNSSNTFCHESTLVSCFRDILVPTISPIL